MSKTALVRQALRLYQSVTERIESGEKVFVERPSTKEGLARVDRPTDMVAFIREHVYKPGEWS